jgi:hypothetical protein
MGLCQGHSRIWPQHLFLGHFEIIFFNLQRARTDNGRSLLPPSVQLPEAEDKDATTAGKGKKVATRNLNYEGDGPVFKLLQDILSTSS